ncbi:YkgJ family cysteine cluster protein [Alicyclobacillus macrosporangiidus]|uniref:YkgJ family cysteine cluster protein n=1 Tax=Alicyclobacillus macrosporangiidus TaxID=392015 RepID=UPI0009DFAA84|nr:YkgJ family cysteine cluster protein [Alicyclobacillus macrosporangiidus]
MRVDMQMLERIHGGQASMFLRNFLERNIVMVPDVSDPQNIEQKKVQAFIRLGNLVDEQIKEIEQNTGIHPTCSKGCSYCCYQAIYVSTIEAEIITYWLQQQHDRNLTRYVKRRLKTWIASFRKAGFSNTFDDSDEYKRRYFQAHIPCPFLTESKTCAIYPVRPSACRTYFSFADPRLCREDPFVDFTLNGSVWGATLLMCFITSHESVRKDPNSGKNFLDDLPTLLPLAVKKFFQ